MRSQAVVVHKHQASVVITKLRDAELIDTDLKIDQQGDQVIIPVTSTDLDEVIVTIDYETDEHEFEPKKNRPSSLKEALKRLVPNIDEEQLQTSYDQIGDIAVIDLNEELHQYSDEVGKAILWSNPAMKAVYRKSSKVDGLLRLRGLTHIAGTKRSKTVHKEHGIRIVVDVASAYFSPRLATEHNRIALAIPENSYVLDMFGSLAPFALHLAKDKDITIDTVDINPKAPKLIKESISKNKLVGTINVIEADAREFVDSVEQSIYDYVLMNHPSAAYDYLSDAISVTKHGGTIYYYDFIEIDLYETIISEKLANFDAVEVEDIHIVRQSSPHEYHVAVELIVSKE